MALTMASRVVLAQVGLGSWGRNLLRNFSALAGVEIRWVCDLGLEGGLRGAAGSEPGTAAEPRQTSDYADILGDTAVDAVVVATESDSHFEISAACLRAGKHVFVEKPMALKAEQAAELVRLADEHGRVLMVGHLLRYHPVYVRLKEMVDAGELGPIHYAYSTRVNLGIVRSHENALWSLAPHDLAVLLDLMQARPLWVTASGQSYLQQGIEDVVFATLHFDGGRMAHVHVSWLDPHKIRRLTVVGARKMAVVDDMQAAEKMRIYDKGVDFSAGYVPYGDAVTLRIGDIQIPYIRVEEPLRLEAQHFIDCVREGRRPRTDGREGLAVIRVLEAAQRSLHRRGAPVEVDDGL